MRILIGILTCHARRELANVQRETWLEAAKLLGIEVKFFLGEGPYFGSDELATGSLDDYEHMTDKARICYQYAHEEGFDWLFTCGDDTWLHPRRLMKFIEEHKDHDYVGHLRGEVGELPDDYASGGPGTLFSRKALEFLVQAPPTDDQAEDRWAGLALAAAGFTLQKDHRLLLPAEFGDRKPWEIVSLETIRVGTPKHDMRKIHQACFHRTNILIAIISCHKYYNERAAACRRTWVNECQDHVDVKFFVGSEKMKAVKLEPDTIQLTSVPDDYPGLPIKVQEMVRWAYHQGYEYVLKLDDDAIMVLERALTCDFREHDYQGRLRGPSGRYVAPYCSGIGYWLSHKSMKVIAKAGRPEDTAEDRWVGNTLLKAGIEGHPDYRFAVVTSDRNAASAPEGPLNGNNIIVAGEYHGEKMDRAWRDWKSGRQATKQAVSHRGGRLRDVCVMVKTFLRDGLLDRTIMGLEKNLSEAKMVIVDDGYESRYKITRYAQLRALGHSCQWMPFDSGFGAKSNRALDFCDRKYVLVASDDFDFLNPDCRKSVEKMVDVLNSDPTIMIASGRVNDKAYEGMLDDFGDKIVERAGYYSERQTAAGTVYKLCDLTVNFSLIRRDILGRDKIHWEDDVKIGGGEHGAFFVDVKRAGHGVAYVVGANIREQPSVPNRVDKGYVKFRARAKENKSRPCFERRGIRSYIMFGGAEDINGD